MATLTEDYVLPSLAGQKGVVARKVVLMRAETKKTKETKEEGRQEDASATWTEQLTNRDFKATEKERGERESERKRETEREKERDGGTEDVEQTMNVRMLS